MPPKTSSLSGGRPTLAEEFGGCTQPQGVASGVVTFPVRVFVRFLCVSHSGGRSRAARSHTAASGASSWRQRRISPSICRAC